MKITDETIMPDGRTFFAWKNEIEMIPAKLDGIKKRQEELSDLFKLFRVIKIASREDWKNNKLWICVEREDMETNKDFEYHPEKYCKIFRM